MVTTKVIVFPVRGRRWAFAAQAVTPVASSSSSSSVSELWKRLLSVPKFTDRAQLLEQYVSTKVCVHFLSAKQLASIIATSYGERQEIHSLVTEEEALFFTSGHFVSLNCFWNPHSNFLVQPSKGLGFIRRCVHKLLCIGIDLLLGTLLNQATKTNIWAQQKCAQIVHPSADPPFCWIKPQRCIFEHSRNEHRLCTHQQIHHHHLFRILLWTWIQLQL